MTRSFCTTYVRAYDFLSQIIDYGDPDLEKRAPFYTASLPSGMASRLRTVTGTTINATRLLLPNIVIIGPS